MKLTPREPTPETLEAAPANSLPPWDECALRVENSDFIAKRVAEGGYGADPDSKLATQLHRFIYEYDDADPYRSAWFMHRLELVLKEARAMHEAAPSGWQPIEIAPKDGRTVIVGRDMGDFGFVRGTGRFHGKPGSFLSGWVCRGFDDPPGELGLAHPTHWMPLPAPPSEQTQAAPGVPSVPSVEQELLEALERLFPLFERSMKGFVFTAAKAGQVTADMQAIRTAIARAKGE